MSDGFALKVGDPDAPKRAFRHTGLDTYAVRSPLLLIGSDCAAACPSIDDDEEEGGRGVEAEGRVVVEPRIGCMSSPNRSMVS